MRREAVAAAPSKPSSLASRVRQFITELQGPYLTQLPLQLAAVLRRLAHSQVSYRTALRITSTPIEAAVPTGDVATARTVNDSVVTDLQLLRSTVDRCHSTHYLPGAALLREGVSACAKPAPWLVAFGNLMGLLLQDLAQKHAMIDDLGESAADLLSVPQETLRIYAYAVIAHPTLTADGQPLLTALELANMAS